MSSRVVCNAIVNVHIAERIGIKMLLEVVIAFAYVSLKLLVIAEAEILAVLRRHFSNHFLYICGIYIKSVFAEQVREMALDILLFDHIPDSVTFLVSQLKLYILAVYGSDNRACFRCEFFEMSVLVYVRKRSGEQVAVC